MGEVAMMNREIYTGNLMYKDIYFTFIYYDGVLKLLPQQGQELHIGV